MKIIFQRKLFTLCFLFIATSCATRPEPQLQVLPLVMPVTPFEMQFVTQRNKEEVYQTLIELAQETNLDAVTLDDKAGLLRFEQLALTPVDLDNFCKFPVVDSDTERGLSNFQAWDQQLLNEGATSTMRGEVTISILLSAEHDERTRVSLRTNWAAAYSAQKQPCNSRGVFETRFEKELKKRLAYLP